MLQHTLRARSRVTAHQASGSSTDRTETLRQISLEYFENSSGRVAIRRLGDSEPKLLHCGGAIYI